MLWPELLARAALLAAPDGLSGVARARLTEYDEGCMWWLVASTAVGLVLVALIARRERRRAGAREARRA